MIYAVTALVFGIPNVAIVTEQEEKRFMVLFVTSILVVSRYVSYIRLAGFALLDPARVQRAVWRIVPEIGFISLILLANAAYFLYRFGLRDITVAAVSAGSLGAASVLIMHLIVSIRGGMTRPRLMRMVCGVLIALGMANMCITRFFIVPQLIGLIALFFGIYTERKSLSLAVRQTVAAASGAAGAGVAVYFLRWYYDPALLKPTEIEPPYAIAIGLAVALISAGYYVHSRRVYARDRVAVSRE
jgi:hypothetical protein